MTAGEQIRKLPGAGINQTSFMFGAIMFAYLFFITVRGDLAKWLGLLGLAGSSSAGSAAGTSLAGLPAAQSPLAGAPALPAIPGIGTGSGAGGLT